MKPYWLSVVIYIEAPNQEEAEALVADTLMNSRCSDFYIEATERGGA